MKKVNLAGISLTSQIVLTTLVLLVFGLVMIGSASVAEGARDFGNKWHFVLLQLKWAGAGAVLSLIISRVHPGIWQKLAVPILGVGVLLLFLVIIPGIGTKVLGARRWLVLPGIVLQPS
ncbi:cell division protein FtsW, partial [Candidatus Microgenomates bacterium CPR3]|nr:cell division protein FtsW [Candidatus Microgenomates bacterium CPR3]